MAEFNADGSIKIPDRLLKQDQNNEFRMKNGLCVTIQKEMVRDRIPKKCVLSVKLSEKFTDDSFITKVYSQFMNSSEVPSKLSKQGEKEFEVEIGSCFSRCRDCTKLINNFRNFLDGNVIEKKGNCTFNPPNKVFCYEDHFE